MARWNGRRWCAGLLLGLVAVGCAPERGGDGVPQGQVAAPFVPGALADRGAGRPAALALPLEVLETSPSGDAFTGSQVRVRFNQPMVALQEAGRLEAPGVLRFDPPLAGHGWWMTPELLVFDAANLQMAQRYEVTVDPALRGLGGEALAEPVRFAFSTPTPRLLASSPRDSETSVLRERPLRLVFSQPVTPEEVAAHLSVQASPLGGDLAWRALKVKARRLSPEEQKAEGVSPEEALRLVVVEPSGTWPRAHRVEVAISAGLRSNGGPLGMASPVRLSFETLEPLRLESVDCAPDEECASYAAQVSFSLPVRRDQLRHITVTPPVPKLERRLFGYDDEGSNVELRGAFKPGTTYTVYVDAGMEDIYGQRLGVSSKHPVRFVLPSPLLDLPVYAGLVRSPGPLAVGYHARHVRSLEASVRGPSAAQVQALVEAGKDPRQLAAWSEQAGGAAKVTRLTPKVDARSGWSSAGLDVASLRPRGGFALVELSASSMLPGFEAPGPVEGIFEVTDLAPWVVISRADSLVRVVRHSDGAPVAGASVAIWGPSHAAQEAGRTDASGLLKLKPEVWWSTAGTMLAVQKGEELALVELSRAMREERTWPEPGVKERLRPGERLRGQVVTERKLYLPGEPVSLVAFTAVDSPYAEYGLRELPEGVTAELNLYDPRGRKVATAAAEVSAEGKVWGRLPTLPDGALGSYKVEVLLEELGALTTYVQVKKFRTPEFQVNVTPRRPELLVEEPIFLDVQASYFFGGPVQLARVTTARSCYTTQLWLDGLDSWDVGLEREGWSSGGGRVKRVVSLTEQDKVSGTLRVEEAISAPARPWTQRCSFAVEVGDVSEQVLGGEGSVLVHPATAYVAIERAERNPVAGDAHAVRLRAVDWNGRRVALSKVKVQSTRRWQEPVWRTAGKRRFVEEWVEREAPGPSCTVELAAAGPDATCVLKLLKEGSYTVLATAEVEGRATQTSSELYVIPKDWAPFWEEAEDAEEVRLLVDRSSVVPGESVQVAVRAPWRDAQGVLLVHRRGLRDAIPFQLKGEVAQLSVQLGELLVPEATLEAVFLVPDLTPAGDGPYIARGEATVELGTEARRLSVTVKLPAQGAPRQTLPVEIDVRGVDGAPAPGRVAVWAVDEAVLSLASYEVPELWRLLLPGSGNEASSADALERVLHPFEPVVDDPGESRWMYGIGGMGAGGGGSAYGSLSGRGSGGGSRVEPSVRDRFETTPLFLGDVALDASGHASVSLELPDNLTIFRVVALASGPLAQADAPGRFGHGQATVAVRAPLVVRGALPQALRPGDAATGGFIVNNGSGPAGTLTMKATIVEGQAAAQLAAPVEVTQPIQAGAQVRLSLPLEALAPGVAKVRLEARLEPADGSAARGDILVLPLPVNVEPTLIEHVAMYGDTDTDRPLAVPLILPPAARADQGGLELSTSVTLLSGLQDGVQALLTYPYGCAEQTSSRLLPLAALLELSRRPDLGVADPTTFAQVGVQRLASMQTSDGGFAYWPGGDYAHPFATAYATWVLQLLKAAGFPVPEAMLNSALSYLEAHLPEPTPSLSGWGRTLHDTRAVTAVFTLAEAGRIPAPKVLEGLWERRVDLPLFGRAMLLMTLHRLDPADPRAATLRADLLGSIEELPATARTRETIQWGLESFFHSDGRSDAIALLALLRTSPDHPLVTKLARGLMERRHGGAWRNTQENAWALVAMATYARLREAETPDLQARLWVQDTPVLHASFQGRTAEVQTQAVPMQQLLEIQRAADADAAQPLPITLQREGQGRLYWRLGFSYAVEGADLPARVRGLTVTRTLRRADGSTVGPADTIPVGDVVALDVTVESSAHTHWVAANIPIPPGLEPIDERLGAGHAASTFARTPTRSVSHQELHPDRVLLFADSLPSYAPLTTTIFLRATTPGRYAMPPAAAEAMYAPEVFGRSVGQPVVVTAR